MIYKKSRTISSGAGFLYIALHILENQKLLYINFKYFFCGISFHIFASEYNIQ